MVRLRLQPVQRRPLMCLLMADDLEAELARWAEDNFEVAARADRAARALNEEQREIFDRVTAAVTNGGPLYVFIDGKAGRGKTSS